jgi:hypothetical protein
MISNYLTELSLIEAHEYYHEEFLLDTKTCLPTGVSLRINYRPLAKVTQF